MAKRIKRTFVAIVDRTPAEVDAIIAANALDPSKGTFDGLTTSEIATRNHRIMFRGGDVRPDDQEWSMFTA